MRLVYSRGTVPPQGILTGMNTALILRIPPLASFRKHRHDKYSTDVLYIQQE